MPGPILRRGVTLVGTAPLLAAAAAAVFVYSNALNYFFSQDDFLSLAKASGLQPRLTQPWRYIANQAVWDLMRPFGAHAAAYHLLSLIVHAACTALLYGLLALRLAPWAALVGATFFAVHPAHFTAVYWFSAIGDPLARCFGLLVLWVQERNDRWRWLAVPLFAISLLCKETLLLMPVMVAAYRAWLPPRVAPSGQVGGPTSKRRPVDGLVIVLAAVSATYLAYFVAFAYGTYFVSSASRPPEQAGQLAYALGWGWNLWRNLLTYLGWTVAFALPVVQGFNDVVDPAVYPWAFLALLVWFAGLFQPRLRARGWLFGGVAWVLLTLPLLPLVNHTNHYYLYAPLVGAAWCVAAATDWALSRARLRSRVRGRRGSTGQAAWPLAIALALLLGVNGAMLVRKIEMMPFALPELRADPTVDRSRIARNVYDGLARAPLPAGVTLLFWSPTAASIGPRGEPLGAAAPAETYWERNVRGALLDGLAVRVLFPQVAEVRFVREFLPAPSDHRYVVYRPDGQVRVVAADELREILAASRARP